MRYLGRSGTQYLWSSPISPFSAGYSSPELSHKCYLQYETLQVFLAPRSRWNGGFQSISDTTPYIDYEYLSGPDMPALVSPYQLDIHCHGGLAYTARVTTSALINQEPDWSGQMSSHTKGKTEIFIYGGTATNDFVERRVLVLSTPGNDNVSRIYVDDNQFHIIGFTEGDIADTTVTSFSDKLFFAGLIPFDIASVQSPDAEDNSYPFEILPGRNFVIRFSSLPTAPMSVPNVRLQGVSCTNVRWIGDQLFALAPSVIGLNRNLFVEFESTPHIPRISKIISSRRPFIVNMVPNVTDIDPFTNLRFTVLYMGWAELNATTIFIGSQKCEIQVAGIVPNYFNGTEFNCTIPFESIETKFVNFTSVGRTVNHNFTLTYRQMPQNISITIDEGQETPIILNCSALTTVFNKFEYRVLETPPTDYGRLLFENKTTFPQGSNLDVGDSLGRM
ncbi:hypothetical protein BKA69DRAFT_267914 [Paraphysoderma sedebokerense]|nr:hypothetical protein BKA69DRAFT_267914 [Paraphysoderma sedebokerense]